MIRVVGVALLAVAVLLSPAAAQPLPGAPDLVFHVSSGYTQASVSWNALPGAGAYRLQITPADQDALLLSSDGALNFPVIPFNPRLSYTATVTTLTGDGATASASVRYTPPPALPALFLPDTLAPLLEPWQDALPAAPTIVAADNALVEDAPLLADSLAWTPEDRFRRSSLLDPFDRSRSYSLHGGTGADSFARGHRPASLVPGNPANARAGLDRLWSCIGGEAPPAQPQPAGGAGGAGGAAPSSPGLSFPGELQQPATDLGGLGRIYRGSHSSGPALVVYRFVSATEGEVAFWVTQGEVAAAGAGCVKAGAGGRIAATKQGNGNVVIAMGPDAENKTFHAVFDGGLSGGVSSITTTYDGPPGANC